MLITQFLIIVTKPLIFDNKIEVELTPSFVTCPSTCFTGSPLTELLYVLDISCANKPKTTNAT